MAKLKVQGNASGTGVVTLTAPNTNTDRIITLPDGDISLGVGIDDNATSTAITIDANENVGIGTTSPKSLVSLSANTGATLTLESGDIAIAAGEVIGAIDFYSNDASGIGAASRGSVSLISEDAAGAGALVFKTSNASTAASEKVRFPSSGGITFNGDTAAANALDDYEEGTWTPSCTVGAIGSYNSATYTKIGRVVTINLKAATFTNASNNELLRITGLPFTPSDNTTTGTAMWSYTDVANQWGAVHTLVTSAISFYSTSITGGFDAMRHLDLNSTSANVYLTATYITNS